jgi:putative hydrolase of the HAD superfamily
MADPERSPRAVIFDLWDTLVPLPARVRAVAIGRMAEALDLPVAALRAAWEATWTRRATGPLEPVVADIFRHLTGRSARQEQLGAALRGRRDVHAPAFVPTAGAVETLRVFRAQGVRIGLLTNCTSDTSDLWRASPLARLVDATAFSAREGVMKPEPSFYLLLLARLGVEPADCAYIGDGKDDELEGAKRLGLAPVLYAPQGAVSSWPGPYAPQGAVSSWPGPTIHSLDEAPELVRAMCTVAAVGRR